MTDSESRALARIADENDPKALRQIARNAMNMSDIVGRAALRRLAVVSAGHTLGTVEHDCWAMVHAVEELRRLNGRRVARMNRMRPKIEKDGEVAALEYCALKETDGYSEIIDYGTPELTAEAIVLRHQDHFSRKALDAARRRLEASGLKINSEGGIEAV